MQLTQGDTVTGVVLKYRKVQVVSEPAHLALFLFCTALLPSLYGVALGHFLWSARGSPIGLLIVNGAWQLICLIMYEVFLFMALKAVPEDGVPAVMFAV